MFRRTLACSFCRRSEKEVAKLVAGSRAYICDHCATEAARIMAEAGDLRTPPPSSPAMPRRVRGVLGRVWHRLSSGARRSRQATEPSPSIV
jgi:hypothetical protein